MEVEQRLAQAKVVKAAVEVRGVHANAGGEADLGTCNGGTCFAVSTGAENDETYG